MNILVTGANGQLGKCLKDVAEALGTHTWFFTGSNELNITDQSKVTQFFNTHAINCVVNCAAYTAVDKAETDAENAYLVNAEAVKVLADNCNKHNALLIHISTDFVFDGHKTSPYLPTDVTNPLGVYGASKLKGETYAMLAQKHFVIRTSWVYSEYGNNFMKTMLRLAETRTELGVVSDQTGVPTDAKDLANFIAKVIASGSTNYGLYHYSNTGVTTWYGFACKIFQLANTNIQVNPIPASAYPTPAKRPSYSLLDTKSTKKEFAVTIPNWEDSLQKCLNIFINGSKTN